MHQLPVPVLTMSWYGAKFLSLNQAIASSDSYNCLQTIMVRMIARGRDIWIFSLLHLWEGKYRRYTLADTILNCTMTSSNIKDTTCSILRKPLSALYVYHAVVVVYGSYTLGYNCHIYIYIYIYYIYIYIYHGHCCILVLCASPSYT